MSDADVKNSDHNLANAKRRSMRERRPVAAWKPEAAVNQSASLIYWDMEDEELGKGSSVQAEDHMTDMSTAGKEVMQNAPAPEQRRVLRRAVDDVPDDSTSTIQQHKRRRSARHAPGQGHPEIQHDSSKGHPAQPGALSVTSLNDNCLTDIVCRLNLMSKLRLQRTSMYFRDLVDEIMETATALDFSADSDSNIPFAFAATLPATSPIQSSLLRFLKQHDGRLSELQLPRGCSKAAYAMLCKALPKLKDIMSNRFLKEIERFQVNPQRKFTELVFQNAGGWGNGVMTQQDLRDVLEASKDSLQVLKPPANMCSFDMHLNVIEDAFECSALIPLTALTSLDVSNIKWKRDSLSTLKGISCASNLKEITGLTMPCDLLAAELGGFLDVFNNIVTLSLVQTSGVQYWLERLACRYHGFESVCDRG
jgi:hypothetical protein